MTVSDRNISHFQQDRYLNSRAHKGTSMTICVAGICKYAIKDKPEVKDGIIFATDHMVSIEGIGQFEHKISKHNMLPNGLIVMIAGTLSLDEITHDLIDAKTTLTDTVSAIQERMKELNDAKIEREILSRAGFKLSDLSDLVKSEIRNEYMNEIIKKALSHDMETVVILLGIETNQAKLVTITENSIDSSGSEIGFAAIGSGDMQAINTLLFQQHNRNEWLYTAIYNIYKAKKNAEAAEGVGNTTDLFFLTDNGQPVPITNLAILDQIYADELNQGKTDKRLEQLFGVPTNVEKKE